MNGQYLILRAFAMPPTGTPNRFTAWRGYLGRPNAATSTHGWEERISCWPRGTKPSIWKNSHKLPLATFQDLALESRSDVSRPVLRLAKESAASFPLHVPRTLDRLRVFPYITWEDREVWIQRKTRSIAQKHKMPLAFGVTGFRGTAITSSCLRSANRTGRSVP